MGHFGEWERVENRIKQRIYQPETKLHLYSAYRAQLGEVYTIRRELEMGILLVITLYYIKFLVVADLASSFIYSAFIFASYASLR